MTPVVKILILEDDEKRMGFFRERFSTLEKKWRVRVQSRHALHVRDAVKELMAREYDVLLLDHDLNGEIFVDPESDDCGSALVRWLVGAQFPAGKPRIIVHSLNTREAPRMVASLNAAGFDADWLPRLWLAEVFVTAFEQDDS